MLADEATGNLDSATTDEILQLFERLNNEGRTIIMVTHEDEVSEHAKRVIRLRDGLIQSDVQNENRVTNNKSHASGVTPVTGTVPSASSDTVTKE